MSQSTQYRSRVLPQSGLSSTYSLRRGSCPQGLTHPRDSPCPTLTEALAPRGLRTTGTHLKDTYASVLAACVPSLMSTRRLGDRDWWLLSDTSIKPATQLPSYESQRVLNHPPILSSCTLIPRDFLRSWLSVSQKGAEKVSSNRDQSQLIQHKKNQTQD